MGELRPLPVHEEFLDGHSRVEGEDQGTRRWRFRLDGDINRQCARRIDLHDAGQFLDVGRMMRVMGQFAMHCTPPVPLAEFLRRRNGDPRDAGRSDRSQPHGHGRPKTTRHTVLSRIETGSGDDASRRHRDEREPLRESRKGGMGSNVRSQTAIVRKRRHRLQKIVRNVVHAPDMEAEQRQGGAKRQAAAAQHGGKQHDDAAPENHRRKGVQQQKPDKSLVPEDRTFEAQRARYGGDHLMQRQQRRAREPDCADDRQKPTKQNRQVRHWPTVERIRHARVRVTMSGIEAEKAARDSQQENQMATVLGQPKPRPEETHDGRVPGSDFVQVGVKVRWRERQPQCQQDEQPNDRVAAMRPEVGRSDCSDCLDVKRATARLFTLSPRLCH